MSSVITKGGDEGKTSLFSGERVDKTSLRVEAYGTLDELNSAMGLGKALSQKDKVRRDLHAIQKRLFTLGMELATHPEKHANLKETISQSDIGWIENQLYYYEKQINLPPEFIIPGKTPAAGAIDVARTIARRLERHMWRLKHDDAFSNNDALVWVNRISDFLFILARVEEKE